MKTKYILLLAFAFWLAGNLSAQTNLYFTPVVIPAQGGSSQVGNFKLDYTIGEPAQNTLRNGNLVFTEGFEQPDSPLPPLAPDAQIICSDTIHWFSFTGIFAGGGADKVEWSLQRNFDTSYVIGFSDTISVAVNINETDTIWLRSLSTTSGKVSAAVYTTGSVFYTIMPPIPPAPQTACSDTTYKFVFNDIISLGCGVQVIDVSTDSMFANYKTFANYSGFEMSVEPDTTIVLWLRSRNVVFDTVSSSVYTTVTVHSGLVNSSMLYLSDSTVCSGDSVLVFVTETSGWLHYGLFLDTVLIAGNLGNDSTVVLSTGAILSPTAFNVMITDTITGCFAQIGTDTFIDVSVPIYTQPYFNSGSNVLCVGQEDCYTAFTDSVNTVYYSIVSGMATIDSISGCVTNVTGNFTIRASIFNKCDTAFADLNVSVLPLLPPVIPMPEYICTTGEKYYILDSIDIAGCGANALQWSFDSTFYTFNEDTVPVNISISIDTNVDRRLWLRSINTYTNAYSEPVSVLVPSYTRPYPPTIPTAQLQCNDTATLFSFDSILTVSCGGQLIEFAFDSVFSDSSVFISPADTSFWIDAGTEVNLWIRSRDTVSGLASEPVYTSARVVRSPSLVKSIPNRSVCSDTMYTFNVVPEVGLGGNKIIWSYSSSFADSTIIFSGDTVPVTVSPASDTILWFQSLDSVSGRHSKLASCRLTVYRYPQATITPSDTLIVFGDTLNLSVVTDSSCTLQWLGLTDTTSSVTVNPEADSAYYTVMLRSNSGCYNSTSSTVRTYKSGEAEDWFPDVSYNSLNNDDDIPHSSLTGPVGRIPGELTVTNSGGANYVIPIEIPSGTNNVSPNLSIVYNSQSNNGVCGWGWNIEGLSSIVRVGKNKYMDDEVAPVQFNSTDGFSLDGQRLIATGGTANNGYGSGNAYATESESFSRIVAHDDGHGGNPDWWDVWTKDGLHLIFGKENNSNVVSSAGVGMIWKLNKVVDNFGNYYSVKYINQTGALTTTNQNVVDEIEYTGNSDEGLTPYNKIKFSYASRLDDNVVYVSGEPVRNGVLADAITITGKDNAAFKTYKFKYAWNGAQTILNEVSETGADGTSQLIPTLFKNGDIPVSSGHPYFPIAAEASTMSYDWDKSTIITGDYNGDGLSDFIRSRNRTINDNPVNEIDIFLRKSDNTGFALPVGSTAPGGAYYIGYGAETGFKPAFSGLSQNDVDGDGRDDLMYVRMAAVGSAHHFDGIEFREYRNGSITSKNISYFIPVPAVVSYSDYYDMGANGKGLYTGDFDGDGRIDVITVLNFNGSGTIKMYLSFPALNNDNNILSLPSGTTANSFFDGNDKIYTVDINGDGKTDLVRTSDNGTYFYSIKYNSGTSTWDLEQIGGPFGYPTRWHTVYWGDFNGDGKSDVLTKTNFNGNPNLWEYAYSTGVGFVQAQIFPFVHVPSGFVNGNIPGTRIPSQRKILLADYNGDGKTDVLYARKESTDPITFEIFYSSGLRFHRQVQTLSSPTLGDMPATNADFNGDGRADVFHLEFNTTGTGNILHDYKVISFQKFGTERQTEKICDGYNVVKEISYALLTSGSPFYQKGLTQSYPVNDIQAGAFCVSSISVPSGSGSVITATNYNYVGAKYHRAGKGFLGFDRVTSRNVITDVYENTFFTLLLPHYVPVVTDVHHSLHATTGIHSKKTTYGDHFITSKRYLVKPVGIKETNMFGLSSETLIFYDSYGNVTEKYAINGPETVDETWSTFQTLETPYPARPLNYSLQKTRQGASPFNMNRQYQYWTNGSIKKQTDFPGTSCETSLSYSYNSFGNVTLQTVGGYSQTDRTTSFTEYDATQRFATKTSNVLSQQEEYTYHPLWGSVTSYTGIDGKTISYEYDAFGRLIKTHSPHGYDIETTYSWDVDYSGTKRYSALSHCTTSGKPDQQDWFDYYDRRIISKTKGWNDNWLTIDTTFDPIGNVSSTTKPYYSSETPFTSYYSYDDRNRIKEISTPISISTYTYATVQANMETALSLTDAGGSNPHNSYTRMDITNKIVQAHDDAGTLSFTYDSYGNQTQVKSGSTVLVTNEFDACGHQTRMVDKDAGTTQYTYDVFKQLTSQTDANGKRHDMLYDQLGRLTQKTCNACGDEGTLLYAYVPVGSNGVNKLQSVTKGSWVSQNFIPAYNGVVKQYIYDQYSHVTSFTERADNTTALTTSYTYNDFDKVTSVNYSSGYGYSKQYDDNGYLTGIYDQGGSHLIYEVQDMNGFGQCTSYKLGDNKETTVTYEYGNATHFYSPSIQDLQYSYQYPTANVAMREEDGEWETFEYDNLDRLTKARFPFLYPAGISDYSYDWRGNITTKADIGNYLYYDMRIHGVKRVGNTSNVIPTVPQNITYTPFNQPDLIAEGAYQAAFAYSSDYQRNKMAMRYNQSSAPFLTRYYSGNYEKQDIFLLGAHQVQDIHYIRGIDGLAAIVVRQNGNDSYYYVYRDNIGSIVKVTDATGTPVVSKSYDAWGRPRSASSWSTYTTPQWDPAHTWLYRGYTGHEELPWFGLVNMNGRLYDPAVGRMLSPDNEVQASNNIQSYNRYSYCLNNPLKYTDPTGEMWYFNMNSEVINWFEDNSEAAKAWGDDNYNNLGMDFWVRTSTNLYVYFGMASDEVQVVHSAVEVSAERPVHFDPAYSPWNGTIVAGVTIQGSHIYGPGLTGSISIGVVIGPHPDIGAWVAPGYGVGVEGGVGASVFVGFNDSTNPKDVDFDSYMGASQNGNISVGAGPYVGIGYSRGYKAFDPTFMDPSGFVSSGWNTVSMGAGAKASLPLTVSTTSTFAFGYSIGNAVNDIKNAIH